LDASIKAAIQALLLSNAMDPDARREARSVTQLLEQNNFERVTCFK
jgi:hypothetical protein